MHGRGKTRCLRTTSGELQPQRRAPTRQGGLQGRCPIDSITTEKTRARMEPTGLRPTAEGRVQAQASARQDTGDGDRKERAGTKRVHREACLQYTRSPSSQGSVGPAHHEQGARSDREQGTAEKAKQSPPTKDTSGAQQAESNEPGTCQGQGLPTTNPHNKSRAPRPCAC